MFMNISVSVLLTNMDISCFFAISSCFFTRAVATTDLAISRSTPSLEAVSSRIFSMTVPARSLSSGLKSVLKNSLSFMYMKYLSMNFSSVRFLSKE